GKGTIAQRCVHDLGYAMLSTGDLLRKHISEQTEFGKQLATYVEAGHLIPDELMTDMVLGWLRGQLAPGHTVILDGFPRTKGQAGLLLKALGDDSAFLNTNFKVVNFDLDPEEIISRISNRLVCSNKKCQAVYSAVAKKPKQEGVCDLCGSPVIRRQDDDESIIRERLVVFAKYKNDLLGFYKEAGQEVIEFAIPAGSPDVVFEAFSKKL
ncbi:nucleoside monophosphate kinase, partial [Candidatus Babeliales bacterium]|nr:nucleoside monophosphate kinase [Candidatus Babeliales bacterium]